MVSRFPKTSLNLLRLTRGKEFSNWKAISNQHDIDIYFGTLEHLLNAH